MGRISAPLFLPRRLPMRLLPHLIPPALLLGNAANLLLLIVMGAPGRAPFYDGQTDPADMSDARSEGSCRGDGRSGDGARSNTAAHETSRASR